MLSFEKAVYELLINHKTLILDGNEDGHHMLFSIQEGCVLCTGFKKDRQLAAPHTYALLEEWWESEVQSYLTIDGIHLSVKACPHCNNTGCWNNGGRAAKCMDCSSADRQTDGREMTMADRHSVEERDELLECVERLLKCGIRDGGGWLLTCRPNDADLDFAADVYKRATGK